MNAIVQLPQQYTLMELQQLAAHVAGSGLFGIKTIEQAVVLMAIAQAEGRPAALAARDYDVIQGRPAKKAEALLRDFLTAGGKVEWHALTDEVAEATFSHPQGGSVRIKWDMDYAKAAGLSGKDNWKKYPRAMLRSRCVSEGCRTVYPMATSGLPVTDELLDEMPKKDVTPEAPQLTEHAVTIDAVRVAYEEANDVPAFQRARELAARLPERDKAQARAHDAATRQRLKGGAQQSPESNPSSVVGPVQDTGATASEGPPSVTLAKLFDLMRKRVDVDMLDADATLIETLPEDQRQEAANEYARLKGMLGLRTPRAISG